MSAAVSARRQTTINPHLVGALALAIMLGASAASILLFGDPRGGAPSAVAHVPPPAAGTSLHSLVLSGRTPAPRPLRGDAPLTAIAAPLPLEAAEAETPPPDAAPMEAEAAFAEAPPAPAQDMPPAARLADPLPIAPLPALVAAGPDGLLPAIGADGTRPGDAYARPFADRGMPRIALIVGALGWDARRTQEAIDRLPPEVTLSFSPYADDLQGWIDRARAAGHEVMIEAPMEPFDYPQNDPGEHTLLTGDGAGANVARLQWLMSRASGYFAIVNYAGEKFLTSEPALTPVLDELARRGLDMVYSGAAANAPMARAAAATGLRWGAVDRALDANLTPEDVQAQLLQLESLALRGDGAMGYGFAYPFVIDEIAAWARDAEARGYALAPASAVLKDKAGRRTQ